MLLATSPIPNASASVRGAVKPGSQTFTGPWDLAGAMLANSFQARASQAFQSYGKAVDGPTAIGGIFDSDPLTEGTGAKLFEWRNGGSPVISLSPAGGGTFADALSASNLSGTNSGDLTLGAFGSSPSASGFSLSGQVLSGQPADATHPGMLSIGAQTIAGAKTLTGTLTVSAAGSAIVMGGSVLRLGSAGASPYLYAPSSNIAQLGFGTRYVAFDNSNGVYPDLTNDQKLGLTLNRWSQGNFVLGDFSGKLTATAGLLLEVGGVLLSSSGGAFSAIASDGGGQNMLTLNPGVSMSTPLPFVSSVSSGNALSMTEGAKIALDGNGLGRALIYSTASGKVVLSSAAGGYALVVDGIATGMTRAYGLGIASRNIGDSADAPVTGSDITGSGRVTSTAPINNEAFRMEAGAYMDLSAGAGTAFMFQVSSGIAAFGFGLGSGHSIQFSSSWIRPSTNNSKSLGQDAARWSDLYLGGLAYLGKVATGSIPAAASGNEGAAVYDDTTNTFKGSDGASWNEFVQSGIAQTISGAKRGAITNLTSSSGSIAIDLAANNNFSHTFTENTTLAAPSNVAAGQSGIITFTQHASSPKTLAFNSFWKFPGGAPATPVTATNSAIDAMAYFIDPSGTFAICQMLNDVKV